MEKRSTKKLVLISLIVTVAGVAGVAAAYTGYVKSNNSKWDNLVYPGVMVENVDIGGKTKKEALDLLESKFTNEVSKKKIEVKAGDATYSMDYSKLNARYNIEEVVNEAFDYGKSLPMFEKNKTIKNSVGKDLKLKFTSDNKYVDEFIADVAKKVNKDPVDGKLQMVSSGNFNVTADVKGSKLNGEDLKKQIVGSINGEVSSASAAINAKVETVEAKVTGEKLSTINALISTHTTNYSSSIPERKNNVNKAARSINGKLLMPGETFSFNGTVGERTVARGYQAAHVIVQGKIEDGLGGGICQVSGTLYNAIMKTNINATERAHHTFPSTYVAEGTDATVDWGNLDYKFKNTLDYPIYIESITNNTTLTFNVYSNSSLKAKTYDFVSEVVGRTPATTKEVSDPTLAKGTRVKDQDPHDGLTVNVYRITKQNGSQVDKKLLYTDKYKKIDGVIKVGTK